MNNLGDVLAADRRRVILAMLAGDDDYSLNDTVLKQAMAAVGHKIGRDQVQADLVWLEQHGLLRITKPDAAIWVATLTEAGQEVAEGRPHPGIARPAPR
jgi:hypothetical protein